ncbi:16415_t:CDS:1 [Gigaspora margarita]|uniref:16415_t:CDS:1 n=1 Tax=Gigaspora margarita TaxID=4874 RepID=A0ABN7VWD4_GIGMA|nr:16415_t:CDS:1 [Gigaspora margarita]
MEETLNKSSNITVGSAINKWYIWCNKKNTDPIQCPIKNIIKFLNDMYSQQKVYNTIASYRLAISEIHNYSNGYPIGRYPDIVKFMIAIRKSNPSPSAPNDPIDIILALDFIISIGSNENMYILNLLQKTAFLIALESASRPSDLHRINLGTLQKTSYGISFFVINPKETNILILHGGNKSVSKKIFIDYYENTELCSALAVLKLLEQTQE